MTYHNKAEDVILAFVSVKVQALFEVLLILQSYNQQFYLQLR